MLAALLVFFKWLFIIIVILVVLIALFVNFAPTFGGRPDADSQTRIKHSDNFDGKTFVNLTDANTGMETKPNQSSVGINYIEANKGDNQGLFKNMILPPDGKNPSQPINTEALSFNTDNLSDQQFTNGSLVWLGHSTVLFRTSGKTIITDPVFHRASPLPIGGKPFEMTNTPTADDMPKIDVVLISHDHYDHLDHLAIKELDDKVKHFYVPLGVKAHLQRWGVSDDKISEYDWYESVTIEGDEGTITLTLTPTRHFSGRGLTNRNSTLWGSWVVQSPELSVYFSGDGGYSPEFAKIGERFGGFDIAFIEDGAYNLNWADVHMLPEQSAQAGIDVKAKVVLPIHWGKFDLSTHQWTDPIKRIKSAMEQHNASVPEEQQITIATPKIGQVFALDNIPKSEWW